jgi:exosortase C (VPDSG-CTERM-specific)
VAVASLTAARLRLLAWAAGGLCLAFVKPLFAWLQLGYSSDLQSCMLLVPFICLWLGRDLRRELPATCSSAPAVGVMLAALGLVALSAVHWLGAEGRHPSATDVLALRMFALVLFFHAVAFYLLGVDVMRRLAFPAAFLFFTIPLPDFVVNGLEYFFQHASASAAAILFAIAGPDCYRETDLRFKLPGGVVLSVAPECSGIRSSYALFLTSLLGGHLLLKRRFNRVFLALFVVPLGIVRNGFRIFTLGFLASGLWPTVLDSWLHHQGGPVFFALSLVPFFALLIWLKRREARRKTGSSQNPTDVPH